MPAFATLHFPHNTGRLAALVMVLASARASARPGMGGGYVPGGSGSRGSSSSSGSSSGSYRSSSGSSSSGSTGAVPAYRLPEPTPDDLFNHAHPDLRTRAKLGSATFQLRADGRVDLVEELSAHAPEPGLGLRYEVPVHLVRGWRSGEGNPSGSIRVKAADAEIPVPLAPVTQTLLSERRVRVMGRLGAGEVPRGKLSVHAEVTFSPGRAGDELAWEFALPDVRCEAWEKATFIHLAWAPGLPRPTVEVLAPDAKEPRSATVREAGDGHDILLPRCELESTPLQVRATFPPGALAALPPLPEPATVLEHQVQVHADGSVTVSSQATRFDASQFDARLALSWRGELQSSRRLHPVRQVPSPVSWDITRTEGALPSLRHRAFGHVGEIPGDAARTRVSLAPPSPERTDLGSTPELMDVIRIRLDEPSWPVRAGPRISLDCVESEGVCELERAMRPRVPAQVEHPAPGEWTVRFAHPVHQVTWQLELDLDMADPTRRLPLYPWALVANVTGNSGMDWTYGASGALVPWAGLALALLLCAWVPWMLARRRARSAAPVRALQQHDAAFRWDGFEPHVEGVTALLMDAWNDGTLERARHVLSSGVYQRFRIQCRLMREVDGVRNRVRDFELLSAKAEHVSVDGGYQVVHVRLRAKLRDVTLPTGTDEASAQETLHRAPHQAFEEIHTWVRKLGANTVPSRDPVKRRECPGCGAPSDLSHSSARCAHCGVVFNAGEADWVLAEITQLSEWNGPREAKGLKLPEGLCRGVLEDKASALFWRALQAGALGEKTLRPFTTALPDASLQEALGPTAGRHAEAVVGGVTLSGVREQEGGTLRATFDVRWSSRRLGPAADARAGHRRSVVTLELAAADRGAVPMNYADASDCAGCGAPAPELYAPECEHCGSALPVRVRDWRLLKIG